MESQNLKNTYNIAGNFSLTIRLVVGWTYFSAFWRRLILADKLNPEEAGYIGEKFNHFLPNALGIKPMIEYLVSNPDILWISMYSFTIIEAIVGLFIMLGLFTRLMSVGVLLLAMGILLGAGWIGTTCLDEWQIGVLGVAAGLSLFFTGGGDFSLDKYLENKSFNFTQQKWFSFLGSGVLPLKNIKTLVLISAISVFSLTLFTNQYFHGGVLGTLHNKSVKPKIEISNVEMANSKLKFQVYRVEGVDVYGSFLIKITLKDDEGNIIFEKNGEDLSKFKTENIFNHYVAKVKPGAHSMIIPLGSKADIQIDLTDINIDNNKMYQLILTDISGINWKVDVK